MHQIFYVTMDPERALGVEDLLPSFHILYSEDSQLMNSISNHGIDITRFEKPEGAKVFNTSKLLEDKRVQDYISQNTHGTPDIVVFKNDEQTQEVAQKLGYNLLNPSRDLTKRLEGNKVEFSKFISKVNIFDYPEFEEFISLQTLDYSSIAQKFGSSFVIQFSFGMSGSGTFFINNEADLRDLQKKFPLRRGKVTRKIEGPTYTVNACITKLGVIIGGISEQITGIPSLTSSLGGTVGNDYSQRHISDEMRRDLVSKSMQFGEILRNEGHFGIFGLDFVLDLDKKKFYLIEANIRQVLSCGFTSYLQRDLKRMPIMLWHFLELLGHDYSQPFLSIDESSEAWINEEINKFKTSKFQLEYNIVNNSPINASQVFFRNIFDQNIKILEQFPAGIYRMRGRMPQESAAIEEESQNYPIVFKIKEDGWSTLCHIKRGYNILEAKLEDGFLINAAPEGAIIPPLGEIGRIQVLESAFSSKEGNTLNGWIMDTIRAVYENMRFEKQVQN